MATEKIRKLHIYAGDSKVLEHVTQVVQRETTGVTARRLKATASNARACKLQA